MRPNCSSVSCLKRDAFRLGDERVTKSDIYPTRLGPILQPISPASARSANREVPPFLKYLTDRLKVPGHRMPTEKPHKEQPTSESNGWGENTQSR